MMGRNEGIRLFLGLPVLMVVLAACPLPFQYTGSGTAGQSMLSDPSSPSITASPLVRYESDAGESGILADDGSGSSSADTRIFLETETANAVIYYTTDGSAPDPRESATRRFSPDTPIRLGIDEPSPGESSVSRQVRTIAIGPNMKPSLESSAVVTVSYPQAAAPTFSPAPGTYDSEQSVTLESATPGADIYYRISSSPQEAPRPVPGEAGTLLYGAPIPLTGPQETYTISAIAVADQQLESPTARGGYTISIDAPPPPSLSPATGLAESPVTEYEGLPHTGTVPVFSLSGVAGGPDEYRLRFNALPGTGLLGNDEISLSGAETTFAPTTPLETGPQTLYVRQRVGEQWSSAASIDFFVAIYVDSYSENPADGVTLREAMTAAETNSAGGGAPAGRSDLRDVVIFDPNLNPGGAVSLGATLPRVEESVVILGRVGDPGAVTLDGGGSHRILEVDGRAPAAGDLTIEWITLQNGLARGSNGVDAQEESQSAGGGGGGFGGAVMVLGGNAGFTARNVVFTANSAEGGRGGNALQDGSGANLPPGTAGGDPANGFGGAGGLGGQDATANAGQPGSFGGGGGAGIAGLDAGAGGAGGFGAGGGGAGWSSTAQVIDAAAGGQFGGDGGTDPYDVSGGGGGAGLGGAVFAYGAARVELTDSSFDSNQAVGGVAGIPTPTDSGTSAPGPGQGVGGAVFIEGVTDFSETGLSFTGNQADSFPDTRAP